MKSCHMYQDVKEKVTFFAAGLHEMLDGSGYPKHAKADNIPIQTRIMTVADIYEALIAKDRPDKKSIDRMKSLAILKEEAKNSRLDNELVRIFIEKRVYQTRQSRKKSQNRHAGLDPASRSN